MSSQLHVITSYMNPAGYASRPALFKQWLAHMLDAGVPVYVVELVYDQTQAETPALIEQVLSSNRWDNPKVENLVISTRSVLWHKENLINIAVDNMLPTTARKIAWIDADVQFVRPSWAQETARMLEQVDVVQPWSEAQDIGPKAQLLRKRPTMSFIKAWRENRPMTGDYGVYWHPGFAWAIRRDALAKIGGLIDWAVIGSADWHMAHALIGTVERTIGKHLSPSYVKKLYAWQERADRAIAGNLGWVEGALLHGFHGRKADRRYQERWKILSDGKFDPNTDVFYDETNYGLIEWSPPTTRERRILRDSIRGYYESRNEDSIDIT